MLIRVTYADGRLEDVDGDHVALEGEAHVVIRTVQLVMGRPREVVVRRIRAVDVVDVSQVPDL